MNATPGPLTYLRRRELANMLRLTRRSPRHLAAVGLFALVLLFFVGEPLLLALNGTSSRLFANRIALESARVAFSGWFVLHTLQWLRAGLSDRVLLLPQAHYDLLFPAPVPRRALVLNHLLSSYLPFLWGSPAMALPILAVAGVWFRDYQPLLFLVTLATFLLFDLAAFNLTTLAAVLVRSDAPDLARGRLLRVWLLVVGAAILVAGLWRLRTGGEAALHSLAGALLLPFVGLADLALAPITGLPAWGLPALALLALAGGGSLLLLVDRFAALTEPGRDAASLGGGRAAGADWTRGVGRFRGEWALAWKTLLALRRSAGRLALVIGVGTVGLAAAALLGSPRLLLAVGPAIFLLYYGLLAEPLFGLFVADLERGDLLRPLPLAPQRVLLGSLGLLVLVGILAGWVPLAVAWPLYDARVHRWLAMTAALVPLAVPLVFLARGLLVTLFPPQREAETLDLFYAAAVELAALFLGLVVVALPVLALVLVLALGHGPLLGWLAAAAVAALVGLPLGWGVLRAYRGRGPAL